MSCLVPIGKYLSVQSQIILGKGNNSNAAVTNKEMESIFMNAIGMINKIPGFENFTTPESMAGTGSGYSPQEARNAPVEEKRIACLNNMPSVPDTSWTSADFKSICQPLCHVSPSAPTSAPPSAPKAAPTSDVAPT